jgi:hypothetical protein
MTDIVGRLREGTDKGELTPVGAMCVEAANEIERLRAELVNYKEINQAREAKLRECVEEIVRYAADYEDAPYHKGIAALALPADDTALKEAIKAAKKEALMEAAEWFGDTVKGREVKAELRRMAEEL